jgi:LAS superfamily LD-carboxypeptidase LdcB
VNEGELTGQARTHISAVADPACLLHAQVVTPFLNLRRAAQADGIDLVPMSSFRDFARQLVIWNGKFSGERPMYDAAGALLEAGALTAMERIDAILLWSALPGASRHHWGTDLDLVDRGAPAAGYQIKLTREEWTRMLLDSDSFAPSRACVPACNRSPGISASRRLRNRHGEA